MFKVLIETVLLSTLKIFKGMLPFAKQIYALIVRVLARLRLIIQKMFVL